VTIGIAQVIPNSNDAGRRKKVCCPTSLRSRHQRKASGEAKRSPGSLRNKIARAREAAPLGHQSAKRTAENSPPFYRWAPRILNPAREADDGIKPGVKRSEPRDHYANQSEEPAKRPIAGDVRKRDHQSTVGRFAGFDYLRTRFLGFRYASPQALCFRPLRGLAECFRPRSGRLKIANIEPSPRSGRRHKARSEAQRTPGSLRKPIGRAREAADSA
jgi:hypothetical protein